VQTHSKQLLYVTQASKELGSLHMRLCTTLEVFFGHLWISIWL